MEHDQEWQAKYEDALLHARWVNGILHLIEENSEEDHHLIDRIKHVLSVVALTALNQAPDPAIAIVTGMGTALRIGYYLGQNGIDADVPQTTPEFLKEHLEPLITPDCDCPSCCAKMDYLRENGVEYEMTDERQDIAKYIAGQTAVNELLGQALPPEDADLCQN